MFWMPRYDGGMYWALSGSLLALLGPLSTITTSSIRRMVGLAQGFFGVTLSSPS